MPQASRTLLESGHLNSPAACKEASSESFVGLLDHKFQRKEQTAKYLHSAAEVSLLCPPEQQSQALQTPCCSGKQQLDAMRQGGRCLGARAGRSEAAVLQTLLDKYEGSLFKLRQEAKEKPADERKRLQEIKGLAKVG